MLVLLTAIVVSISSDRLKNRVKKMGNREGGKANGLFRYINYSSKVLSTKVDSPLCPAAYKDALAKLRLVLTDPRQTLVNVLAASDDAKDALDVFIELCDKTYDGADCKATADGQKTKPDNTGATKFSKDCTVTDPTADTDNCYEAYDALVKALEALKPSTSRIGLKATIVQLTTDFLGKCPKTVNGLDCFGTLGGIDLAVGPVYSDLANVQKNCKVEAPKTNNDPDIGLLSFSASSKVIIMISLMINFYFMI
jgi:hypothetical protein